MGDSLVAVLVSVVRESMLGRVGALLAVLCIPAVVNMVVFRLTSHTLKGTAFVDTGFPFFDWSANFLNAARHRLSQIGW